MYLSIHLIQLKRRGSKMQEDEDDEESKYFKTKPQNQVVKLGERQI